ncbi:MAG: cysteine desulfurase [Blastopirellula sp.]|nr:MAG: cysteine desulfurase [Blastopirellula sp.]
MLKPSSESTLNTEQIRADFPILQQQVHGKPLVYLDNGASTQRPIQVIQAISDVYEQCYSNVHRGGHLLSSRSTDAYEASREAIRAFIQAKSTNEIIFTPGTTFGINLVARSWGDACLKAGDEILVTEMEHHSNLIPWQQLAQRTGAVIKAIPITDEGQLDLSALPGLLTEKTKIVAMTAVSNVLGTINPVAKIVKQAHAVGAVVLVDAAQSVPHEATNVQTWDADFVAFSAHKMLGPSGLGILYGKESLLDAMPPFLGGGSMINTVTIDSFTPAMLPAKFEAGTPPIAQAIALKAAIDYLTDVGMENILQHEQNLTQHAHQRLTEIEGLRILGPAPELKAGLVSFDIKGMNPRDIAGILDTQGVAVREGHHCAIPLHQRLGISSSTRASFYLYNTLEEVDQFIEALKKATMLLG